MADKTCIVNGGDWETGATWNPSGKPGVNDKAIIPAIAVPNAPVGAETIHDLDVTGAEVDFDSLTVSHTVGIHTSAVVTIKSQTSSAGVLTVDASTVLVVTDNIAGAVTLANLASVTADNFNGAVTGSGSRCGIIGICNAAVSLAGGQTTTIKWGASSTLHFTGSTLGQLICADAANDGPLTITADADLAIMPPQSAGNFNLAAATIVCGGNCAILPDVRGNTLNAVNLAGATITGPSLAGKFLLDYSSTGSYTASGFEPLYKLGPAGSTLDSYGSGAVINIPLKANVKQGIAYGPADNEQTGEMPPAGGGGGKLGLGL